MNFVFDSLVKIYSNNDGLKGVGFVVKQKDNISYILTCNHVVYKNDKKRTIKVDNIEVDEDKITYGHDITSPVDLALIEVKDLKGKISISLQPTMDDSSTHELITFDKLENDDNSFDSKSIELIYKDSEPLNYCHCNSNAYLFGMDATIKGGYSGSPILDTKTNKVVAILNMVRAKEEESCKGVSIDNIVKLFPQFEDELKEQETLVDKNTPKELTLFSQQKEIFLDSVQASTFDCSKEEFWECAKEYIGNQLYLSKIEAESDVENMIKILYDSSQKEDLASILHDLRAKIDFNELLKQWVAEHYNQDNEKVVKEKELVENQEDRIYVLMRHIEASKYEVIISPRYSKGNNKFLLEDIDSKECQSKFIDNFGLVKRNVSIHLIVPEELYLENIRLWARRNRKLLDLAHPLYLHTLKRYNMDIDDYSWMIDEWKKYFVSTDTLSNSLYLLKSDSCEYKSKDEDGNALLGVCYAYQPTDIDEIADPLYDAYVSLWSHDTQTEYHEEIIDKFDKITIENLPQKVNECKHISLIWDDMSLLEDFKRELE